MERGAAIRRDRIGASQRVDPLRPHRPRSARSIPRSARRGARRRTASRAAAPRRACCRAPPCRRRAMPSCAASSGWIITVGRCSRAIEVGVSLKVELRKLRAGDVASRNGCSAVASSITSSGPAAPACRPPARMPGRRNGTVFQSGLKRNLPSGQAKPVDVMRGVEIAAGSRSSVAPRARRACPSPNSAASGR